MIKAVNFSLSAVYLNYITIFRANCNLLNTNAAFIHTSVKCNKCLKTVYVT